MADDKKKPQPANDPGEAAPEVPGAEFETSQADETDDTARLVAEVAALKDQLLRALAETENLRRRSRREREDAVRYAAAPLVKDLLAVADNLRRALDSVSAEDAGGDERVKTLRDGIEMTEKELLSAFERHGITRLEPLGERLDPHSHEALFEIPDPNTPAGTVLQVLRPGYRLHDRLLRAAQVGVARGGPPAPRATEAESEADTDPVTDDGAAGNSGDPATGGTEKPGSRYDTTA